MRFGILFTIVLLVCADTALACVMGFSFRFERIAEESEYSEGSANSIDEYLNRKYGKGNWQDGNGLFQLELPKIVENSRIIPLSVGANNTKLSGMYEELKVFVVEYIDVLDNEKYEKDYLPTYYHVDDLSKNSSKVFNFKNITHQEMAIKNVASFKFSSSALPYISTRLNLAHISRAQIFSVFIPKDKSEMIKVIKQENDFSTGRPCMQTYYVRGEWPKGLKSEYRYE